MNNIAVRYSDNTKNNPPRQSHSNSNASSKIIFSSFYFKIRETMAIIINLIEATSTKAIILKIHSTKTKDHRIRVLKTDNHLSKILIISLLLTKTLIQIRSLINKTELEFDLKLLLLASLHIHFINQVNLILVNQSSMKSNSITLKVMIILLILKLISSQIMIYILTSHRRKSILLNKNFFLCYLT